MGHQWRVIDPHSRFEDAIRISQLAADTEPGPIDHWFQNGYWILGGRGPLPQDEHLRRTDCPMCSQAYVRGCSFCCETGDVYRWIEFSDSDVRGWISGLRELMHELADLRLEMTT